MEKVYVHLKSAAQDNDKTTNYRLQQAYTKLADSFTTYRQISISSSGIRVHNCIEILRTVLKLKQQIDAYKHLSYETDSYLEVIASSESHKHF